MESNSTSSRSTSGCHMSLGDGIVHLDVVFCTSEADGFPATSLNSINSTLRLQQVLSESASDSAGTQVDSCGAWRSETFCEYPQEVVFRVNRGIATKIEKLLLLSHHTMIASRIEIFVSSAAATASAGSESWRLVAFQRLGYVAFQSNKETQFSARELKSVPTPSDSALTYIKLLVHACHVHSANLFHQVGLLCVAAFRSDSDVADRISKVVQTPTLATEANSAASSGHLFTAALSPLKIKYDPLSPLLRSPMKKPFASAPELVVGSREPCVWIGERGEYTTPTQILARVQLGRERDARLCGVHSSEHDMDHAARAWQVDELDCRHLCDRLELLRLEEANARSVDERLALRDETSALINALAALDAKAQQREDELQRVAGAALQTQLTGSAVRKVKSLAASHPEGVYFPDKAKRLASEQWHAREDFVWQVVDAVKQHVAVAASDAFVALRDEIILDEALAVAMTSLRDAHPQVVIAASSLLTLVLPQHRRFQEGAAWKRDVEALLAQLLRRLDDLQPAIRNNAAFAIVKTVEKQQREHPGALSDQTLYGLLKVISALLLAFHCCATIDISPKRVLKLLLTTQALTQENSHVREAGKQLVAVLHAQVGADVVLDYARRKKLPSHLGTPLVELVKALELRKTTSSCAGE